MTNRDSEELRGSAEEFGDIVLGGDDLEFDPTEMDTFDLGVADLRTMPNVQYPAVLLSRVLFQDCLKVLQARKRNSYREISAWIAFPDDTGFQEIGTLQLDSDMLLTLRYLRIGVTVYYTSSNIEVLDLDNADVLERFV